MSNVETMTPIDRIRREGNEEDFYGRENYF